MIEAEIAFMKHLAEREVPVAAPLVSTSGARVEDLLTQADDTLSVTCMAEAPGGFRDAGRRR